MESSAFVSDFEGIFEALSRDFSLYISGNLLLLATNQTTNRRESADVECAGS